MKKLMQGWCFLMIGGASSLAFSAESVETEIRLSSSEYIFWDGKGPYFSLCDYEKSNCYTMKMPKGVTPIEKLTFTNNLPDTRATWLVSSGDKNFICVVLPNSGEVKCVSVLNNPQVSRVNSSRKVKNVAAKKEFAEAKSILEGEIAMARLHSTSSVGLAWYSAMSSAGLVCVDCAKEEELFEQAVSDCQGDKRQDFAEDVVDDCATSSSGEGSVAGSGGAASGSASGSGASTPSSNCLTVHQAALTESLQACVDKAYADMDQACK